MISQKVLDLLPDTFLCHDKIIDYCHHNHNHNCPYNKTYVFVLL